ncbi:hypothetical protein BUALT_Bualt02G0073900 [Buddleja alternifolia]|uniref:Dof zinc finger protein n=1 Tax=Buddleja alternifolia TaxID=168488 RepID=A0AAV6XYR2_9LAMI|nr:hypothetical protein BUALT_Bualt02G0073900 [Buddleja alternifolia]
MQDIHAGDGGGRFFGGGGDRRLRPHNHHHHHALKCPRCDSLNTKFCYYNNYNLSQPRHFCKSCRRYWTKGGVLRNVPVGGGCRKTKRAAKPRSSAAAGDVPKSCSNAQSSSSESSSLTAAVGPTAAVREEGSAVPPPSTTSSNSAAVVYNFHDSRFFSSSSANPDFDHHHETTDGQIFPTEIGSFTSMMTSSEEVMGLGRLPPVEDHNSNSGSGPTMVVGTTTDQFQMTGHGDGGGMSNDDGLAAALDWGGDGDQGLFDLTAAIDPANYWSTQPQWTTTTHHNDQPLNYLP